jgi:hypothetical protein
MLGGGMHLAPWAPMSVARRGLGCLAPFVLLWIAACSDSARSWSAVPSGGSGDAPEAGAGTDSSASGSDTSPPTGSGTADAGVGPASDSSLGDGRFTGDDGPSGDDGSSGDDGPPVGQSSGDGGLIGPIIPPDCPGDPTAGWTEFTDTFSVQHPYDLPVSDRFDFDAGIYTLWIFPTDKPHAPGNTTAPRTEMRWSNWTTGEHMWDADMMFESPLTHTCVMQIHNVQDSIAAYMQVNSGDMRNAAGGGTLITGYYDKWFNMKVAFDPQTHQVRTWINNCLKETTTAPTGPTPDWYFKNGVYTCDATICRDHFKNIRFWQH